MRSPPRRPAGPTASPGASPAPSPVRRPPARRAGRAAGVITVALATAHQAGELDADLVVQDLSALSVLVTDEGTETSARG